LIRQSRVFLSFQPELCVFISRLSSASPGACQLTGLGATLLTKLHLIILPGPRETLRGMDAISETQVIKNPIFSTKGGFCFFFFKT
jgi:hypothetical protein